MTRAEYLKRAEACERMAEQVASEDVKRNILKIADGLRDMARSLPEETASSQSAD
jgi:hypothetical protein